MPEAKRRIAHSEASLGWGGQEIRVFKEMEAMQRRGHKVWLFAPVESKIYGEAASAGMQTFALDTGKARYPFSIAKVARELKRLKIEIVNTHSSRDGWIVGLAARLAGVRMLIRSRHIDVDYPNRFLSRIAFEHLPHRVLTTSEKIKSKLVTELGVKQEKISCVATGIDPSTYSPETVGKLRQELSIPESIPLVGVIAVLRSWKGHLGFLDAVRLVVDRAATAPQFILAGDGPIRKKIDAKIVELKLEQYVHLIGHRSDIPNVIASLSMVVLPSYAHEGVPQSLLQAQSMGKAVIGTTVGGIPEIIADRATGLLVPPNDPEALASAMLTLLEDRLLAGELGLKAREQIVQHHSIEHMCEILEAIYSG